MSFGEKIKDLRLNKRLSQTEVAICRSLWRCIVV